MPFFEDLTASLPEPDPVCATTSKAGCYTSWLAAVDIDDDGDLDVVLANGGDYYDPGDDEPSTVLLNDGSGNFSDVTNSMFGGAMSRLRQVGVGDVDGDGDKDIYEPGGYGVDLDKLWIQTAPGVFEDKAAELLPAGLMSNTPGFHLGDLDGDGDLDLVTTDWFTSKANTPVFLSLYLNDGTGKFVLAEVEQDPDLWTKDLRLPPTIPFSATAGQPYWGSRAIDLDFADIDGDFDLDILVNMRNGISRILLNDGKGYFKDGNGKVYTKLDPVTGTVKTISNYPPKIGPYVYNQELCDFDNDGDLDLLLDNAAARPAGASGNFTQVLVNNGKGVFSDESRDRIFGETGSDDNAVKCVDMNNDGNYDLLVASLAGNSEKLLLADGTGKFNMVLDAFPTIKDSTLGIDAADFDGDGIFDVFTGQGEGGNSFFERYYHGVSQADGSGAKVDTLPPKFRQIEKPVAIEGEPIVLRLAVRDAVTSETGDMVKDVSVVYSSPFGSNGKVKAKFIGGDLFRAVIPAQVAYTTVTLAPQATDRRGNKGFGTPVALTVQPVPDRGTGGTGGAGGTGGMPPVEGGAGGEPPVTSEGGMAGGATDEPGSAGTPSEPDPEPGVAGAGEPMSTAGGNATGGSGTGATSSGATPGEEPDEGGAPSSGGTQGTAAPPGSSDDGCTVANGPVKSNGTGVAFAALLLGIVLRRRQRGS
ncbi:MAG TPA: FG-GAP-like repeat-containing protein [Polyangiaceae bacterium]|nr:FG-GAP-like repeat-containing protein [Polyangiaceae bacterium]